MAGRDGLEAHLGALHGAGRTNEAAAALVRGYGPEVLGYLVRILKSHEAANDAFQWICADVVRGLPGFRGEASFRTWLYTIARRRALALKTQAPAAEVPLSAAPEVLRAAQEARSATAPYLRTEVKDAVRQLREQLTEEEQSLLVLRVDRGLDWHELARIWADDGDADLAREAARLRKRFQRTKAKLRRLADEAGLPPG
jgi:RNA polymerase sigma-70 factor (ECF subfamily)